MLDQRVQICSCCEVNIVVPYACCREHAIETVCSLCLLENSGAICTWKVLLTLDAAGPEQSPVHKEMISSTTPAAEAMTETSEPDRLPV